uniref:4Fe-4S ferredoxin-type domain-containing protein n=2 Tax=Xenopus tropicalis TaxID=8364 RepID=A0A1B8Y211_XENTR
MGYTVLSYPEWAFAKWKRKTFGVLTFSCLRRDPFLNEKPSLGCNDSFIPKATANGERSIPPPAGQANPTWADLSPPEPVPSRQYVPLTLQRRISRGAGNLTANESQRSGAVTQRGWIPWGRCAIPPLMAPAGTVGDEGRCIGCIGRGWQGCPTAAMPWARWASLLLFVAVMAALQMPVRAMEGKTGTNGGPNVPV